MKYITTFVLLPFVYLFIRSVFRLYLARLIF